MTLLEEIEVVTPAVDPLADLTLTPAPGAWAASAACVGLNEDGVFTDSPRREDFPLALRVCRHCPVRQECRDYAAQWAPYGLWGGEWLDPTRRPKHPSTVA